MARVLFHVQHLLGVGHLQRSLRIAEALVAAGIDVTLVQGGAPVAEIERGVASMSSSCRRSAPATPPSLSSTPPGIRSTTRSAPRAANS